MRTQCNQRLKGFGTGLAFVEPEEMYFDMRPGRVRLPNEPKNDEEYEGLCGPVKSYFVKPIPKEK